LFNIIHAYSPEKNITLLRKVAASLNPGGLIIILEQLAGKASSPTLKALAQFFGLNYLATLGGQIYAFDEVARWLKDAGFSNPRRINLRKAPGSSLVVARKTS